MGAQAAAGNGEEREETCQKEICAEEGAEAVAGEKQAGEGASRQKEAVGHQNKSSRVDFLKANER